MYCDVLFPSAENSQRVFRPKGKRSRKTSEVSPFFFEQIQGGGGGTFPFVAPPNSSQKENPVVHMLGTRPG